MASALRLDDEGADALPEEEADPEVAWVEPPEVAGEPPLPPRAGVLEARAAPRPAGALAVAEPVPEAA